MRKRLNTKGTVFEKENTALIAHKLHWNQSHEAIVGKGDMDVLKRSVPQWLGGANNINQTQLTQFESRWKKDV